MPYGIVNTAQNNLTRPYGGTNPFAPAGINPMTRQGWTTGLQGMAAQLPGAQQYASGMAGQGAQSAQAFNRGMGSGQFGMNPAMQAGLGAVGSTLANYGGGWNSGMANQINQTGASFNPWNPMLGSMASQANAQLGRDFRQNTMPALNRAAGGAGPGAYGGTRAGVAQGVREQGLADAMQRQTTNIYGQGYESGLGRYVQDRGQTLSATGNALNRGGQLGMQGAQMYGNIGMGSLGQQNEMFRFGHGSMLPQGLTNAYNASQAPGNVMRGLGNAMVGIGGAQQGANQQTINWMNQRYNHAQNYPDQRLQTYANVTNPYLQPGNTPARQAPQQTPGNPMGSAIGGAMVGADLYNQYRNPRGGSAPGAGVPPPTSYNSSSALYNSGLF